MILSILWVRHLKIDPKSNKWSESIIPIFHPLCVALKTRSKVKQMVWKNNTYYQFVPKKSPNRAKRDYCFHWKLKGNGALFLIYLDSQMAILFGSSSGLNWGQSWTKKWNFMYIPCICKNSYFSKCFNYYLHNYYDYLWSEFQFNMMLFTGIIASNPTKWPRLGPKRSASSM